MSMRCKVNNRITPQNVRNMTPEEDVMEDEEDMKEEVDTKDEEKVEEPVAEEEDRSFVITVDNKVTSSETITWLHVPIVKLPTMLSKTIQYYWQRSWRNSRVRMSNSSD